MHIQIRKWQLDEPSQNGSKFVPVHGRERSLGKENASVNIK